MKRSNDRKSKTEILALHWASFEGQTDAVFTLIEAGADVNAASKKGKTALHRIMQLGKAENK